MTDTADLAGSSVLVTGGAGFIGSHLVERLATDLNCYVFVIDDLSNGSAEHIQLDHGNIEFVQGDAASQPLLNSLAEQVEVIFHQAALVSVEASVKNPVESHQRNAEATLTVLEAARMTDTRVVVASSAAIYGHPETVPISENHSKHPTSPYGLDKLTIDQRTQLYGELYDLNAVALRYFNVYGPRQTGDYAGVISVFCEQAEQGTEITIEGDGEQTRDFVHVDDIVQANLLAAATEKTGAYNIGTGTEISINKLADIIKYLTDSSAEVTHIDPREGDIRRSCADISRAKEELGYEPTIELEEGLKTLIDAK
ncbi:GDP-mannose 4,6-dehydratase [Salinarchaeum sp. IM2453]|uniref:GDP-mannose 4,6-dehydratase n=1 Tax=Salinarchaeum sp. IM2453 TaxID=2862870 RepID=UPI001C830B31|nr:GDP-mannose 4,6-dehydratase [Salinarchaeum sp. IM2453]QZA87665.1 GDP-mannose 4,6-dehydratase [Salinarchaeum sp. IM2453]